MNKKVKFNIEDSLFNIFKTHNNKKHSTTKRIPKEIRELTDQREIDIIKKKLLEQWKNNASADEIQYDKFYVIDFNNIKIDKDKIIKDKKNNKNINKIPVTFLIDLNEGNNFLIEIKKDKGIFKEGKIYGIK